MAETVGTRSLIKGLAIVVGVLAVYIAVLITYAAGGSTDDTDGREPAPDGVLVYLDIDAVNGAAFEVAGNVSISAGADLLDSRGDLREDLTVDLSPLVSSTEVRFDAGTRPGALPVLLYSDGDIRVWPFDGYESTSVTVQAYGPNEMELPTQVALTDSVIGWNITAEDVAPGGQSFTIKSSRTAGSLIFDLALCVMLVVLPICTLFVSIQTVRRRKAFQPPMVTWFAVMLFAVLPLRNIFPGTPPFGSWVDYSVVLWVLGGLVASLALYVVAWWKQAP
ncbi:MULTISPECIES: DUF4436 family protein [unclassified Gordonia (in: high G+C Gram-positive bacteria)]|uniref:DUF4436 family protein n=1 Tax=unclassified Gordonia (in: high G+C Gram-positive bacteria) TaxID=2657482 RepID=UPI002248EA0F|nr:MULTISPECIES: DUF4436 family protein [unclassified Gordonia (in: high G+C Gram-positive bacteria)]MCX2754918.1 DUF4436 family protein [Gordonia sp. 4N]MDT0222099.1 DUF4436 family protein [Gordonia sp. AC31]